jgi:hypothetical protein
MNTEGTQRIIDLARKLRYLKAFVHTSTAYAHCHNRDVIKSEFTITNTLFEPKKITHVEQFSLFRGH